MKKKIILAFWNYFHPWKERLFRFLSKQKYWILVIISAYCFADLMLISLHPFLLFNTPPNSKVMNPLPQKKVSVAEYTPIWDFNIFHNAAIPPSLSSTPQEEENLKPRLSRLPLQLNGTIVYDNPAYSIANITIKGQKTSESYQIDEEIENKSKSPLARITQIAPERVYFINLNNNQEEYIEVPNIRNISFDLKNQKKEENKGSGIIKKIGDFQFQVKRSDINKHMRSLSKVLQEAKVVPYRKDGKLIGWRFKYIKPGSIYEKLGFKVSDVMTSFAGELPRSQLEAAEMFQRFRNSTKLDIMIRRNGKDIAFSWLVDEDDVSDDPSPTRFF